MNEKYIHEIAEIEFGARPQQITRKTIGLCNEVYEIAYESESYILRMSRVKEFLYGTHKFLPIFKKLEIKTPRILAEDYSKSEFDFCYQIQNKIDGQDLGLVINRLSHEELRGIAREISDIFDKFNSLPDATGFGGLTGLKEENFPSLVQVHENQRQNIAERNAKTGVIDQETMDLYSVLLQECESYFDQFKSKLFYDDICSKNVMIHQGKFNGLVDLDFLSKGDYLTAIGSMIASWYDQEAGDIYIDEIARLQKLNAFQQKMTRIYAIFHLISWTSEEGIKFNSNSTGDVNWANVKRKKEMIMSLYDSIH